MVVQEVVICAVSRWCGLLQLLWWLRAKGLGMYVASGATLPMLGPDSICACNSSLGVLSCCGPLGYPEGLLSAHYGCGQAGSFGHLAALGTMAGTCIEGWSVWSCASCPWQLVLAKEIGVREEQSGLMGTGRHGGCLVGWCCSGNAAVHMPRSCLDSWGLPVASVERWGGIWKQFGRV